MQPFPSMSVLTAAESVLAIPDRPASKLEPLCWQYPTSLHQNCIKTRATALHLAAPFAREQMPLRRIRCHRRTCNCANRTQHTGSSFGARTDWRATAAQRRLDADATISVDVGGSQRRRRGPVVDSADVRVRAGDTRSACTKTRATTSHLAGPFGPEQLPQHRIPGTSASSVPGPTGVCCARVSAIRQLSRKSRH